METVSEVHGSSSGSAQPPDLAGACGVGDGVAVGAGVGVAHGAEPVNPLKIDVTEQSGNVIERNGRVVRCENVGAVPAGNAVNGVNPFGMMPG